LEAADRGRIKHKKTERSWETGSATTFVNLTLRTRARPALEAIRGSWGPATLGKSPATKPPV